MKLKHANFDRRAADNCGFTLIEVLITMTLFTIGILALAGLQMVYIGGNASAKFQTGSTALAAQFLEQLRSLPYDHSDLDPAANPHQPPAGSADGYSVQWNVTDNLPVNNTKTISITVSPKNRVSGKPVRLNTIIAE